MILSDSEWFCIWISVGTSDMEWFMSESGILGYLAPPYDYRIEKVLKWV